MSNCTEACIQLRHVVADLVSTAQSDLPPADKLELLCVQIGTAAFWTGQIGPDGQLHAPAAGPHWRGTTSELRSVCVDDLVQQERR